MRRAKSDLPQGTLDLLILQIAAQGPIHGYGIAQRIKLVSSDVLQIQQGSLYPALHRLEGKGLLLAEWKPTDTGREAKFYRLSAKGRSQLKVETTQWDAVTRAVTAILRNPEGNPS
jgi:transcriptional regulator